MIEELMIDWEKNSHGSTISGWERAWKERQKQWKWEVLANEKFFKNRNETE